MIKTGFVLLIAVAAGALAPLTAMDKLRIETRVDAAVMQYGVQGRGVVVAIIDRGLDYTNNDFRNPDGTTRVTEIFDLTDNTGAKASNNPYGIGTIHTQAQINAALSKGGTPLAFRDAVGHGTTTTGIAAGNGFNSRDWKYRGEAPKATILVVKVVAGAAAHGDQPAEASSNEIALLPTAFTYAQAKAKSIGLPCVMLLNSGSTGSGPQDGSSTLAQQIDSMVGPNIPGLAFVTGTTDEGGIANHAQTTVAQGQSVSLNITKQDANPMIFTLFYPQADRYDVIVQTPAATFGPYTSPATNSASASQSGTDFSYVHYGSASLPSGPATVREILVNFTGGPGSYTVTVRGATASGASFHAWVNNVNGHGFFTNFVVPGYTVWDLGTAHNNITPTDYVVLNRWADSQGVTHITSDHIGQLWTGAGAGPTVDGRLGVDVSAPGENAFASLAPNSTYNSGPANQIQDGNGFYTRQDAVSAANPQVTGIIALIMEMNPTLDAIQIRDILRKTARGDAFTGTLPNSAWGYGKIDAQAAVGAAAALPGAKPYFSVDQNVISIDYPLGSTAPTPTVVKLTPGNGSTGFTTSSSAPWLSVDHATGTAPASLTITANPSGLAAADYDAELTISPNGQGIPQSIMVHLHVRTPGPLILNVTDGASFGPGFANGSWITITGFGLANTTRLWQGSDFNSTNLPTSLDGVSVVVFSPKAYVYYISPTQINVLAPDNSSTNTRFAIVVNNNGKQSNTFVSNSLARNPEFFTFDGRYIAAVHLDGTDVAPVNYFPGLSTSPAKRGETVELFGTGCGATDPPLASGTIISTAAPVNDTTALTIAGKTASTTFVGVVGNGLCQVNAVIPADLPPGDAEVVLTIGTSTSAWGTYLSVQ